MIREILTGASLCLMGVGQAAPASPARVIQASMTHEGKVVSASDGKLVMTDKDGKNEHTHQITAAAKVLVDGKSAKMSDLKKGDDIKVTVSAEGVVTMVEAQRPGIPTR